MVHERGVGHFQQLIYIICDQIYTYDWERFWTLAFICLSGTKFYFQLQFVPRFALKAH